MKTLLRRIKRSLMFRLLYRLVCWINYPTSRERMWHMFAMGKAQGRIEALKELPIVQVQPRQTPKVTEVHLPPGMWSKHYFEEHPLLRAAIPQSPLRAQRLVPPVELVGDDSWLNSKPLIRTAPEDDTEGEPTEHMTAIKKLRYITERQTG